MNVSRNPCLLIVLALLLGIAGRSMAELTGTIVWNNQDQLDGYLSAIKSGDLVWNTGLFEQPIEVNSDFISHLMLKTEKSSATNNELFRLETRSGDTLFGSLTAITAEEVRLQSQRFGQVSVKREAVRELRQLIHNKVLYDGPRWLDDWRVLKVGREIAEWRATDMGYLTTEKYGGEIYHDLPRLDQAEINLAISWKDKPGFQIDFSPAVDLMGVRSKPKLSIKSWGKDIVAQSSFGTASFVPLLKLSAKQKDLRLRIIWDNANGSATIHTAGGSKLAEVPIDKVARNEFGVLFKNRSDDLTVQQIRLSKWNGATQSEERKPGKPYVRLADGSLIVDSIVSFDGVQTLKTASGNTVSLPQLAIAEFKPAADTKFEPARLRFADGTVLSGEIESLDGQQVAVKSHVLSHPMKGSHAGLSGLRFFNERTHEFEFELLSDGRRLSGNLKPAQESGSLGWAAVGSELATVFRPSTRYTIERRLSDKTKQSNRANGEIVYLKDGTVLLGEVKKMGNETLVVSTTYAGEVELPFAQVRAMEMVRGSGRASFTDKNWKYLQETQADQRSPDHLGVSKTVSMQNQELHHGGRLTFACNWEEGFVGLLTIQLGESGKHVTRCSFSKDRVSARCLVNAASSVTLPSIPDRRANISIESNGQRMSIWVNGILASSAETGRAIPDTGIWIQCGSARTRRLADKKGNTAPRLTISRLRVGHNASRLGAGFAAADELAMLLKLPRNKRKNAPKHVLCATNRDLLRGKLVGINDKSLQFASGYEEVDLPRSKVAAVVWLGLEQTSPANDKESPSTEAPDDSLTTELWLRDGSVFVVDELKMTDTHLACNHVNLNDLSIPLDQLWKIERTNSPSNAEKNSSIADWNLTLTKEPQLVTGTDQGIESPLIDKDVTDLRLTMLEADDVLLKDCRDQVIVLDFWATWCAPCVKSLPKLAAIAETFPKDKVRLIAVNQGEAPFSVQTFLAHQDLNLDVAMDPEADIAKRFAVKAIPQTVVVGPQGKIRRVFIGTPATLYTGVSDAIKELMTPTD